MTYVFASASLLCVLLVSTATCAPCRYVGFRLDDVQDWWLTSVQRTVMDVFQNDSIPLTVGIIANNFNAEYDKDNSMLPYIRAGLNNPKWDLEIAHHGWVHEAFSLLSMGEQARLLSEGASKLVNLLGPIQVSTFMPPFNAFNDDTFSAMRQTGSWYPR
eukprot:TRINITY_DN12372_c0_g1_i2.p1 TRINITY_DN12372_c0_g1~~TRINITY_DN12372_c0_g1_i2.p1  ORF type:complete len:159 (-),score=24.93 TRINITY_DN12372_c0_g1_i2:132-608(-)